MADNTVSDSFYLATIKRISNGYMISAYNLNGGDKETYNATKTELLQFIDDNLLELEETTNDVNVT